MERLENLVKKIRRLGFGRSIDVGAVNSYRLEAEYWMARAKSFRRQAQVESKIVRDPFRHPGHMIGKLSSRRIIMPHRTIAIGDVHGCSLALTALIDAIQPGPEDVMITLGDYINRGPDSRGVLDLLISLGKRCRLFPLLGNHDQVLLDIWAGRCRNSMLIRMGGLATLDSYGPGRSLDNIPREHFAFLEGCRDYYETDTHIFVHANYFPNLPMDEQPTQILRWESLRDMIPDPHHSGKTVIAGHSSRKGGEVLDFGYLKCIDTWCFGGGWLTAMEVETGRTWQADRQGTLRCRA